MSSSRGFTLFETLIAVLVLGLLTLVAVPPIRHTQQILEFNSITYRIRSELHRIRILSIVRNEDCRFRITSPTSYVAECQTPDWITIDTRDLPAGFSLSANGAPEFHPLGNVGPMATIRVRGPSGNEQRIVVSRSGRVRTE